MIPYSRFHCQKKVLYLFPVIFRVCRIKRKGHDEAEKMVTGKYIEKNSFRKPSNAISYKKKKKKEKPLDRANKIKRSRVSHPMEKRVERNGVSRLHFFY